MRIHLTDFPRFVPVSRYDLAIQRMVQRLRRQDGVVSIFQLGNINRPGISDIDMLVVFEDATECNLNPLEELSKIERYLFSHNLYGTSGAHFCEAQRYTFFHNYNLLWGEKLPVRESDLSKEEIQILKTQTALEYLIKMFISTTVELTYGIVRARGLLMHTKALLYDLEFLNITSSKLYDLIQTAILWRNNWFEEKPDKQTIKKWIEEFYEELRVFLKAMLQVKTFYLPKWANLRVAKNMRLVPSKNLSYTHKGITLPTIFGRLGTKYFNLQHRFNKFQFHVPIASRDIPVTLQEQFTFIKQMKTYNNGKLAYFMALASSLNIL